MRTIQALLIGLLLPVGMPASASEKLEDTQLAQNLRCESLSFAGKPWEGNVTFVKIRPKEGLAYIQDMGDRGGWIIFRIKVWERDQIKICQEPCSESPPFLRVIDRITGVMADWPLNQEGPPKPFVEWLCRKSDPVF